MTYKSAVTKFYLSLLLPLFFGFNMKYAYSNNWLKEDGNRWMIVNDDVMGGLSSSKLSRIEEEDSIRFEGLLSLKNNGGFSSVRALVEEKEFADAKQICIEVRGDGREYQFRLRDNFQFGGYAYAVRFKTEPETWQTIYFSPKHFFPLFRGRLLTTIPPIEFKDIKQLGFLLADKKEQGFRLDIRSIRGEI